MPSSLAIPSEFPIDLEIEEASGSYIKSREGKNYLDFIAGVAVSPLGHGHPRVKKAIQEQLEKHCHVMVYGEYRQSIQEAFAEKLTSLLPEELNRVFLINSGAEANEAAIKLAKAYTERSRVFYFSGAYHGSTHGALSISGNEARKRAFRPLLPECFELPFNDTEALERIDERTAAVFLETIQGDAGVKIPGEKFMKALRNRCSEKGALLVLDEVQCGLGRTGERWAFEAFGIVPDLVTTAKALGGGLPLGALIGDQKLLERFHRNPALGHITTTGGHPLSCAAGKATIEAIEEEELLESVERKGAFLEKKLKHPKIRSIRRKGLMLGIDLNSKEEVDILINKAREKGVLLFSFLSRQEAFRIAPPLNISNQELEEGSEKILEALDGSTAG